MHVLRARGRALSLTNGWRQPAAVFAVLVGVLVMHGGLGVSACTAMSMTDATASVASGSAVSGSLPASTSSHQTPTVPDAPAPVLGHENTCTAPLPPTTTTAAVLAMIFLGMAVLAVTRRRPFCPLRRRSGPEPPRPRWLDPRIGLGVLRT